MLTQFASLQLTREELKKIHAALVQQAMVEDDVRRERGQERVEKRDLLDRFEALLGDSDEALHTKYHEIEDELWEYAWYTFTDEWAWFRASQDVEKELETQTSELGPEEFRKMVERHYQKKFETYVREVEMRPPTGYRSVQAPH